MKLLLLIFPEAFEEEVRPLLDRAEAPGWTEIRNLIGFGEYGLHLGNQVWPGKNSAFLCVADEAHIERLVAVVKEFRDRWHRDNGLDIQLRAFSLPAEVII